MLRGSKDTNSRNPLVVQSIDLSFYRYHRTTGKIRNTCETGKHFSNTKVAGKQENKLAARRNFISNI